MKEISENNLYLPSVAIWDLRAMMQNYRDNDMRGYRNEYHNGIGCLGSKSILGYFFHFVLGMMPSFLLPTTSSVLRTISWIVFVADGPISAHISMAWRALGTVWNEQWQEIITTYITSFSLVQRSQLCTVFYTTAYTWCNYGPDWRPISTAPHLTGFGSIFCFKIDIFLFLPQLQKNKIVRQTIVSPFDKVTSVGDTQISTNTTYAWRSLRKVWDLQ